VDPIGETNRQDYRRSPISIEDRQNSEAGEIASSGMIAGCRTAGDLGKTYHAPSRYFDTGTLRKISPTSSRVTAHSLDPIETATNDEIPVAA